MLNGVGLYFVVYSLVCIFKCSGCVKCSAKFPWESRLHWQSRVPTPASHCFLPFPLYFLCLRLRMFQFHLFPVTNLHCVQSDLSCELWWMCLDRLEIYSPIQLEKAKFSNSDSLTTVERTAKKSLIFHPTSISSLLADTYTGLVPPTQGANIMNPA